MLAGIAGAALAAWWWHGRSAARQAVGAIHDRGEVIFRNTPQPSGLGGGPM